MQANKQKDTGWTITFYCGCQKCCGKEDNIAADGTHLTNADALKVCAAPKEFDFGGWNGVVTVHDRGGAIKGKRLDIYCGDKNHHQDALKNEWSKKK